MTAQPPQESIAASGSATPAPYAARVIPAARVQRGTHKVLIDSGSGPTHASDAPNAGGSPHAGGTTRASGLTVVPIVDGDHVAGFEIRCGCGCQAFVECLPAAEETTP